MPQVAARTHVGHVRTDNEDSHLVTDAVFLVADGLGGHRGGEVASEVAVRAALEVLRTADDVATAADQAFAAAHRAVCDRAEGDAGLHRMGTTLVTAALAPDGRMHLAGVGDSRAYWLDGDGLRQVTVDDNEAEQLAAAGVITREEARSHPGRHVLTSALVAGDEPAPRPRTHVLEGSGRLLLCTDGLTGEVEDCDVALLLGSGSVDDAADALVAAALEHGGSDNVTVVVVDR